MLLVSGTAFRSLDPAGLQSGQMRASFFDIATAGTCDAADFLEDLTRDSPGNEASSWEARQVCMNPTAKPVLPSVQLAARQCNATS